MARIRNKVIKLDTKTGREWREVAAEIGGDVEGVQRAAALYLAHDFASREKLNEPDRNAR